MKLKTKKILATLIPFLGLAVPTIALTSSLLVSCSSVGESNNSTTNERTYRDRVFVIYNPNDKIKSQFTKEAMDKIAYKFEKWALDQASLETDVYTDYHWEIEIKLEGDEFIHIIRWKYKVLKITTPEHEQYYKPGDIIENINHDYVRLTPNSNGKYATNIYAYAYVNGKFPYPYPPNYEDSNLVEKSYEEIKLIFEDMYTTKNNLY